MGYSDENSANVPVKRDAGRGKVAAGVIIFILGVIAGVVGLCVAVKFIFFLGLAVAVVAAVALVTGIITVRNRYDGND